MAIKTQKSIKPEGKDVKYLNKDFASNKSELINFAKTYFPNSYSDFSAASPGTMFIEMASYIGDVAAYYTDYAFKEGLIEHTNERKNLIALAKFLGYKVKPSRSATAEVDLFQLCPAIENETGEYVPDEQYCLSVKEHAQFANTNNSMYILEDSVNFAVDTKLSPRIVTVYQRDVAGIPTFFLLKKTVKVIAGKLVYKQFNIESVQPFLNLQLDETNVLEIVDVKDSDNNKWYEVDYLAQELVFTDVPNNESFEGVLSNYNNDVPCILKYLRTPRRFTVKIDANNKTLLEFGAGTEGFSDEIINLSSQTVGVGLSKLDKLRLPLDPSNFLNNESYGVAPSNTTITVKYLIGGGLSSNCPSNDITRLAGIEYNNSEEGLTIEEVDLLNTVKNSVRVNNPIPATGGKDAESDEEIRQNAMSYFAAQNRAVTKEDYLVRIYAMPSKYGSIAKANVVTNNSLNDMRLANTTNPFAVNIYVLSYDSEKKLVPANPALIENLIKYIKKYRVITDSINILDGYVINIGVEFAITVYKGYNKKEVLYNCIKTVQNFFDIDFWNFSQPINLSQLELEIAKVEGVQSIVNVKITNKNTTHGNYSSVEYDIESATKNKIVYPSLDPSIFECRFPESDIRGSIV